jgi:predicted DNA-binding transcriptional regulator AlpA
MIPRTATTLANVDVGALPTALTTERAAELLGVTRVGLWKMAGDGTAPVPFFHVGRLLRWPTAPILRLLELDEASTPGPTDGSPEGTPRDEPSTAGAA